MVQKFRYVKDGFGYPSVTEILRAIPKPGLQKWKEATPDAEIISRDRATIGTITHWKIQRFLAKKFDLPLEPFKVDDLTVVNHNVDLCTKDRCHMCQRKVDMKVAIETIWSFFEELVDTHDLKPIQLEQTVYNPKYGYAGTLDYYGKVDGEIAILDWKTSKAFYNNNTYGAQLASYNRAFDKKGRFLYVGRLNEETGWELREVEDDWDTFLDALELYKKKHPDRLMQKV